MSLGVVIPAFNASRTLERAVRSAVAAGADNVVVVDDGSTDDTSSIAADLGCTVVRQENGGAASARRAGLAVVESEFTIMLDADDELVARGCRLAMRRMADLSVEHIAIVGMSIDFTPQGDASPTRVWEEGISVASMYGRGHSPAPPAAIVWRTEALKRVYLDDPPGLWPRYAEDYELLLRAVIVGKVSTLAEVVCRYSRVGGKSARHPERSIAAAQDIRAHYSNVSGATVGVLSSRLSVSLKLRKYSSLLSSPWQWPIRLGVLLLAAILDKYYRSTLLNRLASRIRFCKARPTPKRGFHV